MQVFHFHDRVVRQCATVLGQCGSNFLAQTSLHIRMPGQLVQTERDRRRGRFVAGRKENGRLCDQNVSAETCC